MDRGCRYDSDGVDPSTQAGLAFAQQPPNNKASVGGIPIFTAYTLMR